MNDNDDSLIFLVNSSDFRFLLLKIRSDNIECDEFMSFSISKKLALVL